ERPGGFNGIEILALDVLDQRHLQGQFVGDLPDYRGHFGESGSLRRAPAPLAGDQLKASTHRANHERLNDAAGFDRPRQLFQRLFSKTRSRLIRTWLDQINIDMLWARRHYFPAWRRNGPHSRWRGLRWRNLRFRLPNERSEPPSQCVSRHWRLPPEPAVCSPRPLCYVGHRK